MASMTHVAIVKGYVVHVVFVNILGRVGCSLACLSAGIRACGTHHAREGCVTCMRCVGQASVTYMASVSRYSLPWEYVYDLVVERLSVWLVWRAPDDFELCRCGASML